MHFYITKPYWNHAFGLTGQTSNVTNQIGLISLVQQQFVADARRFGISKSTALVQPIAAAKQDYIDFFEIFLTSLIFLGHTAM